MNKYTKITKTQVITRLLDGKEVVICPCNLMLDTPWQCESTITLDSILEDPIWLWDSKRENRSKVSKVFNKFLLHYEHYNCNEETGNKANFFVKNR
jgi:hypothetical protein